MRFKQYLEQKIAKEREHGRDGVYPIRLTPGQYTELESDLGRDPAAGFVSCNGLHSVERIECHTRATGDNVILCPREDLFAEVESDTGLQMVSLASSITHVPDNVGCCEIVSVGELVDCVAVGDIAFIDFFSVKQGYILAREEHYVAGGDAFTAKFDPLTQEVIPLDNHVITRRANDRMKIAMNGTDRVEVLDYILTDGIVSGRSSNGTAITHTLYQEVVSVGKLTNRPRPGVMTRAEKHLLDLITEWSGSEYDSMSAEEARAVNAVRAERLDGRRPDIKPGDLVAFCKELAMPARTRGEHQHVVPYDNVLAVIDDASILEEAIRANRAGKIQRVA